jgi:hypothetical protein
MIDTDDAAQQIQQHLDNAMKTYLAGPMPTDQLFSIDGEMRGLSIALAVLRGTSGMDETLAAEQRVKGMQDNGLAST